MKRIPGLLLALLFLASPKGYSAEWNGIRLTPTAGVSEIYDDNITFQKEDTVSDFITSMRGGLSAKYETELATVKLDGSLNYELFADRSEFDNLSGKIGADWSQELSEHDRLRVKDDYLRADEPRTFAEAFNRQAGRFGYQTNSFAADYTHDFNSRWSGVARYSNEFTIFSTDLYEDSYLNGIGAGAVYHDSPETRFLIDYDFKTRDFSSDIDATTHTLSAGVRHYLTRQLYVDGKVGLDFIDAYDGRDLTKPLFQARLTDELDEITAVDVAFEKEYSMNAYTADIFDHWQISSSLRRELTRRLRSAVSLFYGEGEYLAFDRHDDLGGVGASLAYDLAKDWQGILRYTLTNVDSTQVSQEYRKNVVQLGLVWNF
ncbi:MAG: outer membrane beta-barrel protein [Candidatus Omnitrophica bacterium]|nr:outer membrane beta-barrel protein [Candidatus Omnitrophota bacterium]